MKPTIDTIHNTSDNARQEAPSLSARRQRRYRLIIAVLLVVLLGLGAYILVGP